ncbi:MAG TPA: MarR family winged helix-turn-helix transcriptional regulator [Jatrophihabitans sp.]|jgi:DNA-binding MarR family transcriptional regulator
MPKHFESEDVARLRIALARIAKQADRQVSGDGSMTGTQLSVLGTVMKVGPVGATELADIEGLNPTMLSRIIGKLETAGLVTRSTDPDDRRAVQVTVTKAGAQLQERRRRERTALFAERLSRLDQSDVEALLAALPSIEALAKSMRRPSVRPQPAGSPR